VFDHFFDGIDRPDKIYRIALDVANRLLRSEKFDGILRASRPRLTNFLTGSYVSPSRVVAMHRFAFIKSDAVAYPARFLAVAGGSTPPQTLLSLWRKRV
jgi:hypothetical protein